MRQSYHAADASPSAEAELARLESPDALLLARTDPCAVCAAVMRSDWPIHCDLDGQHARRAATDRARTAAEAVACSAARLSTPNLPAVAATARRGFMPRSACGQDDRRGLRSGRSFDLSATLRPADRQRRRDRHCRTETHDDSFALYDRVVDRRHPGGPAPGVLPTLARLVFAGVLLFYFWGSGLTKIGPGAFRLSRANRRRIYPDLPQGGRGRRL